MVKAQQRQPATIAESRNAPHSPSPAQSVFIHGFSPRSDSPPQPAPTLRPPPRPAPTLLRRAAGSRSAGGTPAPPPRRRPPQRRPSTDAASRSTTLHLVHAAVRLAPPLIHDADLLTLPSASHRRREGHFLHAAVSSPRRTSSAPPRRRPSRASQVGATVVARRPDAALAVAAAGARPLVSSTARRAAAQLSFAAYSAAGGDIEDSPVPGRSLLARFRERRALAITDITATEWCEKQMEFVPEHSKPERNEAMRAGSERHVQLEQEVVERVEVTIRSAEELWAVKFMDFMMGTNQLMFEGITREIPVIGVVEGSWMIGIIDEIRMPIDGISFQPILVDSKTRVRPTIPSEAQKRNGSNKIEVYCHGHMASMGIRKGVQGLGSFGFSTPTNASSENINVQLVHWSRALPEFKYCVSEELLKSLHKEWWRANEMSQKEWWGAEVHIMEMVPTTHTRQQHS